MRSLLSVLLLGCAPLVLSAQEQYGIAHSDYAGTDALFLNPARVAGQWPYMDVRISGVGLFLWNDLVAMAGEQHDLLGEVRKGLRGTSGEIRLRETMRLGDHSGFVRSEALAPGFSMAVGRGGIAAGIRSRALMGATGISPQVGRFLFNGMGFVPQHGQRFQEEGLHIAAAAWTEASVTYAHIVHAQGFAMISVGGTARYLMGHSGAGLDVDVLDYTVSDTARADLFQLDARYGVAMPAFDAGRGWGGDLGVVYERTMDEADRYVPHRTGCDPMRYRYRVGISLIDLGGIRYTDAVAGSVHAGSSAIADYEDLDIGGAEDVDSLLTTFGGHVPAQDLRIGMPTALSLQFDQRITDLFHVALGGVQRIPFGEAMRLRRPNSLALTPRFGMKYAELAVPVSVIEYDIRRPVVGVMLRLNNIVIGSDNVLPFIARRDVHTADVYFRVKWTIFRSPHCKGKGKARTRHTPGAPEAIPCMQPN